MQYHVFGMCNALYDIQAEIPDALLAELNLPKGAMILIEEETQRELVAKTYEHIVNSEPGGSGANTMIGIAQLGGKAAYTSRVAQDEHGQLYAEGLANKGVRSCMGVGDSVSGICVVLITPDAERTLCTFLGASRELQPEDVDLETLRQSQYLYVTGYLWDTENQKAAVLKAMHAAKEAGVKIAFSLSDSFCVHRHQADFLSILSDYVDLVFGNEEEVLALTGESDPHTAIHALAPHCHLAVLTLGPNGSLVREGESLYHIPGFPVKAIDATGAGDMYAAGFLYGVTQGMPLTKAGRLASYLAAQVVSQLGPRLDSLDKTAIAHILAEG